MKDDTYYSTGDSTTWYESKGQWQTGTTGGSITITDPTGTTTAPTHYTNIDFDSEFNPVIGCLVCGTEQEDQICTVCAVAVRGYRNEAFLKQIAELL